MTFAVEFVAVVVETLAVVEAPASEALVEAFASVAEASVVEALAGAFASAVVVPGV